MREKSLLAQNWQSELLCRAERRHDRHLHAAPPKYMVDCKWRVCKAVFFWVAVQVFGDAPAGHLV